MATTELLRQDLEDAFGPAVASNPKLISECVNMCQMFSLSATDLQYKWEALSFSNTRSINVFTMDSCAALKAKIQRDKVAEQAKHNKPPGRAPMPGSLPRGRLGGPPKFGPAKLDGALKVGLPPVRSVAGDEKSVGVAGSSKVAFKGPENNEISRKQRAYRYMYEKVSERSEVLDDRIDEFAEIIREHYDITDLGDPSAATEDSVTVVGRICIDSEQSSQNVKLTETSLILETSRMMGSGARIPLKFDPAVKIRGGPKGVGGVGLFPGAIVALNGKNGGGGWFLVDEVLAIPPLNPSSALSGTSNTGDTSFSMYIASGPFTPDADLDYKPWHTLLDAMKTTKPAVLLLIGPFIDIAHTHIRNGDIDSTPTQLFREQFIANIHDFLKISPDSTVLIVPSIRDIINDHAVFPQRELSPMFAGDPRVRLLPNPCRFTLNDVSFAVSSVDVLFHLRKEEFFKRTEEVESLSSSADDTPGTSDSMSNLCRHILQQRSFYPIFPVPLELTSDVNLDVSHLDGLKLGSDPGSVGDTVPDVLILPSRLKHFSKVVDNTVTVNPSFLSKNMYSVLSFKGEGLGPMKERISADHVKLS